MLADPIADLRSPSGALVSVYLNRPSPGGFSALVTDTLRPLREKSGSLPRSVQMSLRKDTDRIRDLADRFETDPAPSFAVFASDDDNIFLVESLTHEIESRATVGPRPYLRPLRAAPRPLRAGIVVADRTEARTFVATSEHLDEIGAPLAGDTGKPNYGGFGGYAEHTVRSRAEQVSSRIWREAGARLLGEHQRRAFDFLAVGSQEEIADEIIGHFHPYLADLYRAQIASRPRGLSVAALRAGIGDLSHQVRMHRQSALAGHVLDTAWSGGQAVLGLTRTIEAANAQAIGQLVVAGWFSRPGTVCTDCGSLDRSVATCVICRSATLPVDDVVSELMDIVVAGGGAVNQISVASPLDREGVGALTRYPVSV